MAGDAWYLNHKIHRVVVKGLRQAPTKGIDVGTENILMVGSTSRCALAVQSKAFGLCSQGVTGVNSDVVMILHVDQSTHSVSILSIPRDLFVPNAPRKGRTRSTPLSTRAPRSWSTPSKRTSGSPFSTTWSSTSTVSSMW